MTEPIQLIRAQFSATACRKDVTRYEMHKVRLMADGVTESTNGRTLIRVYPKKKQQVPYEMLIDGKALAKAATEIGSLTAREERRGDEQKTVTLNPIIRNLSYETRGKMSVSLRETVTIRSPDDKWPPTDDIVKKYGESAVVAKTVLAVKELEIVLAALKKTGCEAVRLDFLKRNEGIRFVAEGKDAYILGLIMPMAENSPLESAEPPNYEDE